MITAMQSARIKTTSGLVNAREELLGCRSFICYQDGREHATRIEKLVAEIDLMILELVPNESIKLIEGQGF